LLNPHAALVIFKPLGNRRTQLDIALEVARKLDVEQQITMLPGNMFSVDYGQDKFDIARLGYVTYFFGADDLVRLFRRINAALACWWSTPPVFRSPICKGRPCSSWMRVAVESSTARGPSGVASSRLCALI